LNFKVLCKRDVRGRDRDETKTLERQDRDVWKMPLDVRDRDYNPGTNTYTDKGIRLVL